MSILKKVLHLNYGEEKNQKQVIKSYNFEVAPNTEGATPAQIPAAHRKTAQKQLLLPPPRPPRP